MCYNDVNLAWKDYEFNLFWDTLVEHFLSRYTWLFLPQQTIF